MVTDIFKELFTLLNSYFETYQSIGDTLEFIRNCLHYFNAFIGYLSPLTYFIPKSHCIAFLSFAISCINLRVIVALYKLLNPLK